MLVVGVDGCPGGWVAVAWNVVDQAVTAHVHATFAALLEAHEDAGCIAVDIPIGLAAGLAREADLAARKVLGPRRSSVFPAPDARIVEAATYEKAQERSRALTGKGVSRQAFAIFPKVAEVNAALTSEHQNRVIEVHPEVSFWAMAGNKPMAFRKGTPEGYDERHALLATALDGVTIPTRTEARQLARPAKPDDVLDAIVAAWSAYRFATGRAGRLPAEPPVDRQGLRMEIVF